MSPYLMNLMIDLLKEVVEASRKKIVDMDILWKNNGFFYGN